MIEKIPLDVRAYKDEESGQMRRGIFVGGELFDWGFNEESLHEAANYIDSANAYRAVSADICKHFLESFNEFLGKKGNQKMTIKDVNQAIENGYIEIEVNNGVCEGN